jgi:hypothetical protein
MRSVRRLVLSLLLAGAGAAGLAACGGDDDGSNDDTTTTSSAGGDDDGSERAEPAEDLVDTTFCKSLLAIDAIDSGSAERPPEQVVSSATQVRALLDDAAAAEPEDAPEAVGTFFDDTMATVDAIIAAAGDVDAAYQGLATSDPDLVARLTDESAYEDAVDFVYDRCGLDIGG